MQLHNKIALVSGSSRGIGREIARQLLQHGATVIMHGKNNERLQQTIQEFRSIDPHIKGVAGDISDPNQVAAIVAYCLQCYSRLDIVVNNAAISMRGAFERCTPQLLESIIKNTLLSSMYMSNAVIPSLKQSNGTLLFISSAAGLYGFSNIIPYSAAKMAIRAMQEGLSSELAAQHVHVKLVYLDFVKNDDDKWILDAQNRAVRYKRTANRTQQQAAHKIVSALRRRRSIVYVGTGTKVVALFSRYFPRLFRSILHMRKRAVHTAESS